MVDNPQFVLHKKRLHYSSVVYFSDRGTIVCLGVLIAQIFALTDGPCGSKLHPYDSVS